MPADHMLDRRALLGSAAALTGAAIMAEAAPAAPPPDGRIIDVHAHAILPVWRETVQKLQNVAADAVAMAGMQLPPWSPELHLGYMDRHGIAAAVLSWPEGTSMLRGRAARDLARAMNENYAEIVAKHPTRFGAFATVPLDDMDAAVEETAYALDVLKLDGIASTCHFDGAYLGDPRYDPWFAELHRRGTVLFVHPSVPKAMEPVYVGPNPSTLEFMFDTTRMVTKMVITGAKARYAGMKMISTHGGGTIPYLAHRITISTPFFGPAMGLPKMTMEEVNAGLSSFHYDLTASTSPAQLDALRRLVPTSQLMMGFDWPMMPEPMTQPEIRAFGTYPAFGEAERSAIIDGNALKLFPALAKRRG